MKALVAVIFTCLLALSSRGQQIIDVEIANQNNSNCQLTLTPNFSETSTLSNVVFALKWKATENLALGEPQSSSMIVITKSGPIHTAGGWKYQIYSGCGFTTSLIEQPIIINIAKSGATKVYIANDNFLDQVNGRYYVSVGGEDVTGQVLFDKNLTQEQQPITMYYDPLSDQFLIQKENRYFTITGQRVFLLNTSQLITVRKSEAR